MEKHLLGGGGTLSDTPLGGLGSLVYIARRFKSDILVETPIMQHSYGFGLQRNTVMIVGGMNFGSNWVDCHVNSTIYLLSICQLCSFSASSLKIGGGR